MSHHAEPPYNNQPIVDNLKYGLATRCLHYWWDYRGQGEVLDVVGGKKGGWPHACESEWERESLMRVAKCRKATVICLLSRHTFRATFMAIVCVCVSCLDLAYCRQCPRCVSFAISKHLGTKFPLHTHIFTQLSATCCLPLATCVPRPRLESLSSACCYCCSFPPHSLGWLNGQAAASGKELHPKLPNSC